MKNNHSYYSSTAAGVVVLAIVLASLLYMPYLMSSGKSYGEVSPPEVTDSSSGNGLNGRVTVTKGEGVRSRLEHLKATNKGFARALKEYEKSGKKLRIEDCVTVRLAPPQPTKSSAVLRPVSYFQDQSVSDGDSEIDFFTYSGDEEAWDGIVQLQGTNLDETYSGIVDTVDNDVSTWTVSHEIYYPADGGEPQCGHIGCLQGKAQPGRKHASGRSEVALAHHGSPGAKPPLFGFLRRWWGCTSNGCGWSGVICGGSSIKFLCQVGVCAYGAIWCIFNS
jgi:hypothetical protein